MKKQNNNTFLIGICAFLVLALPKYIFAVNTFDLSCSLTEGGTRLELNVDNPYKGVRLDVNTDISLRYEVIQKITRPIQNRDNPNVVIGDNFVVRGLRGTNRYGNFSIPTSDIPVRPGEVLYVSNSEGNADSFTLVYGITNIENITPGYYQGQIAFTLRPIGSSQQEVTKYLYLYIIVGQEGQVKPSIEIITETGSRSIILNSKNEEASSGNVLVKISGNFKKFFSITQSLTQPVESNDGRQMGPENITVAAKEAKKGVGTNRIPLSSQPQVLYTSSANGEADESFIINYSLADLSKEKAGRYKSRIQFSLDEMGAFSRLETLDLEVENQKIFDLVVVPQDQKGTLEFRNLKPKEPPKQNEVLIEIKTNVGKQYQVTQKVYSDLTSKEGETIPPEYFTLRTEGLDAKGFLRFPQKEATQKGETILFISDKEGSPDKFKITYELSFPENTKAGDYSTRIVYSLSEI